MSVIFTSLFSVFCGSLVVSLAFSFFSASNEIPNFNNPEERILKALYDRFDLKVHTHYVQNKTKRMEVLHKKQDASPQKPFDGAITMQELVFMQDEVRQVTISKSINELWDNILCELRKKEIHVSDRTYFNYSGLVKAEAWLQGRDQVLPEDMGVLVNYLWNRPEEIPVVGKVIQDVIEDPMGDQIRDIQGRAYGYFDEFSKDSNKNKALVQLTQEAKIAPDFPSFPDNFCVCRLCQRSDDRFGLNRSFKYMSPARPEGWPF